METLLQPESIGAEARSVSDILAKANPAEMPAMRTSLSFLTSAGAELARVLEKRDQELAELRAIVEALPPEWVEAAKAGTSLPDVGALRAELQLAKDERDDLQAQLVEREGQAQALQERIAEIEAQPPASVAVGDEELELLKAQEAQLQADLGERTVELDSVNTKAAELQTSLDEMAIARAGFENDLRDRDAELGDIENQLAGIANQLTALLPSETAEAAPEAAVEGQDPRQRRAIRLGALAAAVAAVAERSKAQGGELQVAMGEVSALQEQITSLTSERVALQANVEEQEQSLMEAQEEIDGLRSDIEGLSGQVGELTNRIGELQADLDATLAAKAQVEEQLQARESELAELNQQVEGVQEQLRAMLPEDVLAQLSAEQGVEAAPAAAGGEAVASAEGGEAVPADGQPAPEIDKPKALGLAALTSGVALAFEQSKTKSVELDETAAQIAALNQQIETLAADKMAMEADLEDKDRTLEDLNIQIESLNEQLAAPPVVDVDSQVQALTAQVADLQGQLDTAVAAKAELEQQVSALQSELDAANAAKAELEQQLSATQAQLADLTGQVDDFKQQIQGVLSPEDLAALQAGERVPAGEGEGGEEAPEEGVSPLGLAALAGGVAVAVNRRNSRAADLDQANAQLTAEKVAIEASLQEKDQSLADLNSQVASLQDQLGALTAEKAGLEASLQEKEQALAVFNEQWLGQQGQVNELAAEKSTTEAVLQQKDEELAGVQAQVQAMQATIDDLTAQLQAAVVEKTDLEAKVEAAAPLEQAVSFHERLSKLPAIKQTAASAALMLGKQPVLTPKVQALTSVAGIGSVRQQKLYNAGVGTFWELSNLDNDQLMSMFALSASRLQRVDFDETRASARQLAEESDTIGMLWDGDRVDDMEALTGVGRVFEQRLYQAGITTYELLAGATSEQLADIIHAPDFNRPDYGEWIVEAKALAEQRLQESAVG